MRIATIQHRLARSPLPLLALMLAAASVGCAWQNRADYEFQYFDVPSDQVGAEKQKLVDAFGTALMRRGFAPVKNTLMVKDPGEFESTWNSDDARMSIMTHNAYRFRVLGAITVDYIETLPPELRRDGEIPEAARPRAGYTRLALGLAVERERNKQMLPLGTVEGADWEGDGWDPDQAQQIFHELREFYNRVAAEPMTATDPSGSDLTRRILEADTDRRYRTVGPRERSDPDDPDRLFDN